jgi:hypothetical protein
MNEQGAAEVSAWNFSQSLHYTFPPASLIVTIALSSTENFESNAVARGIFTGVRRLDGPVENIPSRDGTRDGYPRQLRENDLTEIFGFLDAFRCRVTAVVNFFAWPRV